MKLRIMILAAFLCLGPSLAEAANVSIGASGWYAHWKYENDSKDPNMDETFKWGPDFLYGPVASVSFLERWSLSSVFLYGKYDVRYDDHTTDSIKRYDSDSALNFSVNRYLKVFAGFKYMGYKYNIGENRGYGPGAGIGLMLPLLDDLFLLCNLSGLYIRGKEKNDYGNGSTESSDIAGWGLNSNLQLAYNIAPLSTNIIAGYRYQYFRWKYDNVRDDRAVHQFHGVTLSAVFSFDL